MVSESIPDDVREFVQTHVDSIAELEALLLLRRETSALWDATTVAKRLYIPDHDAAEVLRVLLARGFLKFDGKTFQYQCSTEVDTLVGNVADVYARQLIPMTHLIHNKSSRIREFANAFKLRKEPK
jgi:hypothetical protein